MHPKKIWPAMVLEGNRASSNVAWGYVQWLSVRIWGEYTQSYYDSDNFNCSLSSKREAPFVCILGLKMKGRSTTWIVVQIEIENDKDY